MAQGRPTIAAIAREVGVSVPTVSKVLNGRLDVAPATRTRVEEALARHRYRKPVAGTPGGGGPRLLDLVFHEAENLWAQEIISGVEHVCGQQRIGVVLSELGGSHRPPQEWIDDVMARRPLGVLLVLSSLDETQRHQLSSRSIPFVVLDTQGEPPPAYRPSGPTTGTAVSPPRGTSWASVTGGSPSSRARRTCCARAPASTATAPRTTRCGCPATPRWCGGATSTPTAATSTAASC
ncbi:hypothetical protein GCM10025875_32470 [Litorihabitans aurantiacus]|uniref:HTH lacI-type domain-containing protein n=1 Tax=Litorihabitans aurantiacus TaxID=1930061 RepID=A0AA37XH89_9MICO|nr:hypothetical protein GCM10025875_32470 [Litorihabitans aurantiacus]